MVIRSEPFGRVTTSVSKPTPMVLATRFAYRGDRAVGFAVASRRPDARVFVTHRLADDAAFALLLGVRSTHRRGFVALALLRAALDGASAWGVEDIETHTARPALQRRIERLGGVSTGGFVRLVRRPVSGG